MLRDYLSSVKGLGAEGTVDPIFDQTCMASSSHIRKMMQEGEMGGFVPWHFEQNLHECVFIPAGCPHQVRNLKSCIKVSGSYTREWIYFSSSSSTMCLFSP